MKYIFLKGEELEKLNFIPTIVIAFYNSNNRDKFIKEYKYLSKKFNNIDFIACSSPNVIENNLPFIDLKNKLSTVYLIMDLDKNGYSLNIFNENDKLKFNKDIPYDILILSSFSSRKLRDEIVYLSKSKNIGHIVGGVAGVKSNSDTPTVFINGKFYDNKLIILLLNKKYYKIIPHSFHLFNPVGLPMQITKAKGNQIIELDKQPAIEALEAIAGKLDDDVVNSFGYPLFLNKFQNNAWEDKPLASIVSIDRSSGIINLYKEVIENEYIKIGMMISRDEQLKRLRSVYSKIDDNLPSLIFMCIGMKANLGIMEHLYLFDMKKHKNVNFIGFHSFGEIGPAYNSNIDYLLHNQSMTFAFISKVS